MKKYLAVSWSMHKIGIIEIERETNASVWINGRKIKKLSKDEGYFDSWEEAKEFLVTFAKRKVHFARKSFEYANTLLDSANDIKEPL